VESKQWVALIYLGVIASGVSFFLWNVGARKTDAGTLAVMNNLKIPLAAIVSLTVFGEEVQWTILLAGILIFIVACVFPRVFKKNLISHSR
jgi:drug/metabolite transporter (DMT)-like permease